MEISVLVHYSAEYHQTCLLGSQRLFVHYKKELSIKIRKKKKNVAFHFKFKQSGSTSGWSNQQGDVFLVLLIKLTFLSGFTSIKGCLLCEEFRFWMLSILCTLPACVHSQQSKNEQLGNHIAGNRKKYKGLKQISKPKRKFAFTLRYSFF